MTAQTQAESVLAHQTRHDPETDLPNALALREHLVGNRAGSSPFLLLVRLDDLEAVTTGSGAAEGRALLVEAAARLKAVARPEDLVARSASDELAFVVQDAGSSPRSVVDRVLTSIEAPRDVAGQPIKISVTIGGATVAEDDEDPLRRAGLALREAKAAGRGQVELFHPGMESTAAEVLSLRSDLERAVAEGEFELWYQPQVHLRTGTIRGVEALLRWRHPTRGLVPPDQFIPLTEEMGIIRPLGRWVLLEACRQLRLWADAGLPELRMAVNLSAMQLEPRLVKDVRAALAGSGLDGRLLELEITETVAVRQGSGALAVLTGLRQLGTTLSVDDFGTGYSMLDQLRTFPFTQLKIDKSFVKDVDDFGRAPLVEAMIAMSRALGLEVVAEGVETVEQLSFLQDQDCDLAQGYLLSRPVDADQITALLRQSEPLPGFACAVVDVPDCADWLSRDAALQQFVRPILSHLQHLTGLESTYLTYVRDGVQQVTHARNTGALTIAEGATVAWPESLCSRALNEGPAVVLDARAAFPDCKAVADLGLHAYVGVPVHTPQGHLLGTLCAASADEWTATPAVLSVLEVYAQLIGERVAEARLDQDRAREPHQATRPAASTVGVSAWIH